MAADGLHTQNPNAVEPPVRRSLGRKNSSETTSTSMKKTKKKKKKKVPQRGMGVEKLERQRIQEELINQTFINNISPNPNPHYLDLHFGINNHLSSTQTSLTSTSKKKVNMSMNSGSESTCGFAGTEVGNCNKGGEVGMGSLTSTSSSWVSGGRRVMMEYNFFPPPAHQSPSPSPPPQKKKNCVDLSLRL